MDINRIITGIVAILSLKVPISNRVVALLGFVIILMILQIQGVDILSWVLIIGGMTLLLIYCILTGNSVW